MADIWLKGPVNRLVLLQQHTVSHITQRHGLDFDEVRLDVEDAVRDVIQNPDKIQKNKSTSNAPDRKTGERFYKLMSGSVHVSVTMSFVKADSDEAVVKLSDDDGSCVRLFVTTAYVTETEPKGDVKWRRV